MRENDSILEKYENMPIHNFLITIVLSPFFHVILENNNSKKEKNRDLYVTFFALHLHKSHQT